MKFRDAFGAADSYVHAMSMMVEGTLSGSEHSKEYCAFMLMIDGAKKEINDAQLLVDDMEAGDAQCSDPTLHCSREGMGSGFRRRLRQGRRLP